MSNPYEPPRNFDFGSSSGGSSLDVERLVAIAGAQRDVNLALLGYLACGVLRAMAPFLGAIGVLIALIFSLIAAIKLADALHGRGIAILCAVLMFVPCVNLMTLLVLSSGATNRLKAAGVSVGFLGTSAEEVRQMLYARRG